MYLLESRIRYSECDSTLRLSPGALLNYFQDCSTFQSEDRGRGFDYLLPQKLVWVLASWQIVIHRLPKFKEQVVVGTMPYDFKSFLGYRNFFMKTREGEMLVEANSLWTLLNFETGKPSPPTPEHLEGYQLEPRLEMEYAGRKIVVGAAGIQHPPVTVAKHHLDSNHHVNNGQYIGIAMEYLPEGFEIAQIRAEYKKQAYLHDVFYPYVVTERDRVTVSLRDEKGGIYANIEVTAAKEL